MTLQAIKWKKGSLEVLDQLLLPAVTKYIPVKSVEDGWNVIYKMQVRGAPAIAIVGCLSLFVELYPQEFSTKTELFERIDEKLKYLITARPTAVNIKKAAEELTSLANQLNKDGKVPVSEMKQRVLETIEEMLVKDVNDNKAIGENGAEEIIKSRNSADSKIRILTHCNTGSLATAGYGTALGVIRSLYHRNVLEHAYCTETRPYNQGSRLTAYELVYEKIPATLICDDMVAALMKLKDISAVVVGADRVVANGDTANKIGTYQIAIIAKYHNVPFYVAAPRTTIDLTIASGDKIVIEERSEKELTHIGDQRIAAPGIKCWNPAFDVTPANLITGIITEVGVFRPEQLRYIEFSSKDS